MNFLNILLLLTSTWFGAVLLSSHSSEILGSLFLRVNCFTVTFVWGLVLFI